MGHIKKVYKGRLFTFGCSFTHYNWPTWADLIGQEFEEYYNYGKSGAGNLYIACNLAEAIVRHNINKNDTVMIMWTNVMREDRYVGAWISPGNIFTQNVYNKNFVKKFVTVRGYYVRDLALMQLVDVSLAGLGCSYHFMSMVDVDWYDQYNRSDDNTDFSDLLDLYKDTLSKFKPSVHSAIFNNDWRSRPLIEGKATRPDLHPSPLEHVEYINKILPEYQLSDWTIEFAKNCEQKIKEVYKANPKVLILKEWDFHDGKRVPDGKPPDI